MVLYRQTLDSAASVASLRACAPFLSSGDRVTLWDNSPEPQDARALDALSEALPLPFTYLHHPDNKPLSYAYNEAVRHSDGAELIVFLDQDSHFDGRYLTTLREAARAHPEINLFAPLIRHGNQVVSPGHFRYFKGKYWSTAQYGPTQAQGTVAIMSGVAVRTAYLQQDFGGFDERLKLYGIDTNLFLRYAKTNRQFYVLDVPFGHDLSDFNDEPYAVKQRRFEDFARASRHNARLFPVPARWLTGLFLWYKRLQLRSKAR